MGVNVGSSGSEQSKFPMLERCAVSEPLLVEYDLMILP